jgi:3-dehydroquinate synthetase
MLDLKDQINATLAELIKTSLIFTEDQWELMEDLVKVLVPCEQITRELSSQKYPSIFRVIGLFSIFFKNIFYI